MHAEWPQETFADQRPIFPAPGVGRPVDNAGGEVSGGERKDNDKQFAPAEDVESCDVPEDEYDSDGDGRGLDGADEE
jgi:hypothetical protein